MNAALRPPHNHTKTVWVPYSDTRNHRACIAYTILPQSFFPRALLTHCPTRPPHHHKSTP